MKALRALLVPALAAGGLAAAVDAPAQAVNGATRSMSSGGSTAAIPRHAGTTRGTSTGGHRHGGGGHHHWRGHHHHHHGHWHGRVGFYFGVPLLWSSWYWGWPYYDPYYYAPRGPIVYREVERVYPEGEVAPATTEVQRGPGAPTEGPLYMNYCESAKAYYPKVESCPEGWKFIKP